MSFTNKVVLVTGASGGIGAATALMFAKEGANVVIVGRNEEKLKNVNADFDKIGKRPLVIKADVSKEDEAKSIIKQTIDAFGKLDVLVNNAGILRQDNIYDTSFMNVFDEVMNTNLRAVVLLTNLAVPYLVETKGNIVNVSSVAAQRVKPTQLVSYKTSKAGLNHFTRCIALELAAHGVRVNTVSPGPVATDIFDAGSMEDYLETLKKSTALGRIGQPEEISDIILFLASDKAKSITGSDYVSDNGLVLM